MRRLLERFEAMAAAVAFAEAGEWDYADEILRRPVQQNESHVVKRTITRRSRTERTDYR